MSSPYYDSDVNADFAKFDNAFSEKAIRLGFIRKVYSILMVQLAITTAFIALFVFVDEAKMFAIRNSYLVWIAFVLTFVMIIVLACCEGVRRSYPTNFICLFIFTILESFLLGLAASAYEADAVLMAAGICAVVCLGLTLFAFQTKYDFTVCGAGLAVALLIFVLFGFIAIFLDKTKILQLVYGSIGALIFSLYLVYDTQLMIGGEHKYSISPEEYIFAALNLYLDIINIFLYILQIISAARSGD